MSDVEAPQRETLEFRKGLISGDLSLVRSVPKSDLHNHCLLGIPIERMEEVSGMKIPRFRHQGNGIRDINQWIKKHYQPVLQIPGAFPILARESFRQAARDGVAVLEMSIDAGFGELYGITPEEVIATLREAHSSMAPQILFQPSLGFSRSVPVDRLRKLAEPYFSAGFFTSIDLYDDELAAPAHRFCELFQLAKNRGLRCTAHTGEFGTAEDVRETVETLQLDAVQHGIAAASSVDVMKWLAKKGISLNICPTSNLMLGRTETYKTHPVRILFDHGIRVTINTDDVTLFGQGVSEEFMHLFQAGLFSVEELDEIRKNGLRE